MKTRNERKSIVYIVLHFNTARSVWKSYLQDFILFYLLFLILVYPVRLLYLYGCYFHSSSASVLPLYSIFSSPVRLYQLDNDHGWPWGILFRCDDQKNDMGEIQYTGRGTYQGHDPKQCLVWEALDGSFLPDVPQTPLHRTPGLHLTMLPTPPPSLPPFPYSQAFY